MISPKTHIGLLYGIPDKIAHFQAMKEIKRYFNQKRLPQEQLKVITEHSTRLTSSIRLQEMMIWRGNRGYLSAAYGSDSRELQKTLTINLLEADLMDERDDEYDVRIINAKLDKGWIDENTYSAYLQKYHILNDALGNLKALVFKRYEERHPSIVRTMKIGRNGVERAQEKDKETHFHLLNENYEWIRSEYGDAKSEESIQKIKNVSEGKVAPIAETAAKIDYRLSGGESVEVEERLIKFWGSATAVLQLTYDDYPELEENIERLDTNPIIIAAICSGMEKINKESIREFLRVNPGIVESWPQPYINQMRESLKEIKKYNFNSKDHEALEKVIEYMIEREKLKLKKKWGLA